MIIVGTRPELIRLAPIIGKIESFFKLTLVHTGQNYDYNLNKVFFDELGIRNPDYYLDSPGDNLGKTIGNIISKSFEVMVEENPDALLVLGDTNSSLSVIAAKRLKIPIFHMEAGNRCFDQNVPEEINRKIVDHVSDINLAYTENARRYLIREGLNDDFVYVTGSPMTEVINLHREKIENSDILNNLGITSNNYFVVSSHREENLDIGNNFQTLMESLNQVAETYSMPIIFSTHPRTAKRMKSLSIKPHKLIRNLEPLGFFDYIKLQSKSYCVLSDSGTISEEATILGFPAVSIRTSMERPEALDAGTIVLGGIGTNNILSSIKIATSMKFESSPVKVPDYNDKDVSNKVIRIIQSYTEIVNRRVWNKS